MIRVRAQRSRGAFSLDVAFESDDPILALFGASGAGKSTLVDLIAGVASPDEGVIDIDGEVLFSAALGIRVPAHRRSIGVAFQDHRLFPHRSVRDNLIYGARRQAAKPVSFDEVVGALELAPHVAKRPGELSGGERQRVALGRAILSAPRLLLLDEPLASVDRRLRDAILPWLRRTCAASGTPIIHVSHDLGELLRLTDRLLLLDRGRVVGSGAYRDLVHDRAAAAVVHERGMTNLLEGTVTRREPALGTSTVAIAPGTELTVPMTDAAAGERVVLSIAPKDVALAGARIERVSIQNQVAAVVGRISMHERMALVEVLVGERPLLAEVSHRAVRDLALASGSPVVCLMKSQAIECR